VSHKILCLAAGILISSTICSAQVATGTPPFSSIGGGPVDAVNLANLNAHLSVPVINRTGRGIPFGYTLTYDSSVWYPVTSGSTTSWQPVNYWGWGVQTAVATGYITAYMTHANCYTNRMPTGEVQTYSNWEYIDQFAVIHAFSGSTFFKTGSCGSGGTSLNAVATDGSGYTLQVTNAVDAIMVSRAGKVVTPPYQSGAGAGTATDTNGNQISVSSSGVFTDTLGNAALTVSQNAPGPSNPTTFTYTPPSGTNVSYTMKYTNQTILTNFGCSGISEYSASSVALVSEIDLPDGTKYLFSYEATPGHSGDVTGRLASVTLPTGGTISYAYSGGSNGITCADGSTATLTRTTPDGTWAYAHSESGTAWTTTVTDAMSNQTVLNFQGIYETQRQVYQGSTGGTLLKTHITCYNGNTSNCNSTAVTLPITQRTGFLQWPGTSGLQSRKDAFYNSYGLVTERDEYAYGVGAPGSLTRKTLTTYASLGNGIVNRPATVTVQDGSGNVKSQTTYTYDQGTITPTSGTPQHVSVTGSRGNLTTASYLVQGTTTLSKTYTYYDTGTVNTATDVNGAQTTYNYGTGSCGNSFVTSVSEPLSLSRSMTWNCTGGVELTVTDENGRTASSTYNDPYFWRTNSTTDAASDVTNFTYTGATLVESSMLFGTSTSDVLTTLDPLGRSYLTQRKQGPSSGTYDSVEKAYNSVGLLYWTTLPYAGTAGQGNSSAPSVNNSYDALGRNIQITDSDNLVRNTELFAKRHLADCWSCADWRAHETKASRVRLPGPAHVGL
jgi:hypothetical protein